MDQKAPNWKGLTASTLLLDANQPLNYPQPQVIYPACLAAGAVTTAAC